MQRQRFNWRRPSPGGILVLAVLAWLLVALLPVGVKAAIGDVVAWPTLQGVDLWRITSAGHLLPGTTGARDVGSASLEVRAIYAQDVIVSDDLTVTGDQAMNGSVTLGNAGTDSVTVAGKLYANDNVTLGNANTDSLTIEAQVYANDNVTVGGALDADGGLTVTDTLYANDNVDLGSSSADLIAFNGRVRTDILPEQTDAYKLGGNNNRWSEARVRDAYLDTLYILNPTSTASTTINVLGSTQFVLYTGTGAPVTVNLPAAASGNTGKTLIVKDAGGGAGTNNITIDANGAETIDGAATLVISSNYGVARLYCNGTAWFTW